MNILLVHNFYKSNHIGGEDVVFTSELKALREYASECSVYTYTVSNDDLNIFSLLKGVWGNKAHANRIQNIIKENNIHLVHIHNTFPQITPLVFRAVKKAGAKCVLTLHNYRPWCIAGSFIDPSAKKCMKCLEKKNRIHAFAKRCYRNSWFGSLLSASAHTLYEKRKDLEFVDVFFYLSNTQKQQLLYCGLSEKRLFYKPNFVPLLNERPTVKEGLVFVGRLEKEKGLEYLLALSNQIEEIILVIGEKGDCSIDEVKYPNLRFLGKKSRADTLSIVARSKYLLHLSIVEETFGLSLIEALSVSTPVIGFRIGTRLEFIKHQYNGFLCEPETLCNTVNTALQLTDNSYKKLANNAVLSAQEFTKEVVIKKQIGLYKHLCQPVLNPNCH